jgi:hypothetical protein
MFRNAFPAIENLRLLDLGGTVETWHRAPVRPRHVTVLLHERVLGITKSLIALG